MWVEKFPGVVPLELASNDSRHESTGHPGWNSLSLFANFQGSSRAIVEKFRTSDSRAKMEGGETLRNSYYHSVNCY